jgi:hypothetical protein
MKHQRLILCILVGLVFRPNLMSAATSGVTVATIKAIVPTRFDLKLLDSTDPKDREALLSEMLFGVVEYRTDLGDLLYARYQTETNIGVKTDMLAVLHKYKHPSVSSLFEDARASTNRAERETAAYVESGIYSNAIAVVTIDALCTNAKHQLKHLDLLTRPLWFETLFTLRYNAAACGYDAKVGDALAEFFLKHLEPDFFQIRVGISMVLLEQKHPALRKLIESLKASKDADDRELATYLESKTSKVAARN